MSFNGTGTFLINSTGQPVVANTTISANVFNALTADLANGLSTCMTKDGQSTPTGNIKMGNFKITNVGAPTATGDALSFGKNATIDTLTLLTPLGAASGGVPTGAVLLWSGSVASIPTGWHICDGTGGTPDLRNMFVIGAGSTYAVGDTGGAASVTLSTGNLPSHNHGVTDPGHVHAVTDPTHKHGRGTIYSGSSPSNPGTNIASASGAVFYADDGSGYTNDGNGTDYASTGLSVNSHTTGITTQNTGSGTAVDTLPPYYALAYIMKL